MNTMTRKIATAALMVAAPVLIGFGTAASAQAETYAHDDSSFETPVASTPSRDANFNAPQTLAPNYYRSHRHHHRYYAG